MASTGVERVVLAFVCMIVSVIMGIMIYYDEVIEERDYQHSELKQAVEQQLTTTANTSGQTVKPPASSTGTSGPINVTDYTNVPSDWMSVPTGVDISFGRLFRVTNQLGYLDASNNGDKICNSVVTGATLADYRHLKYAYGKNSAGIRNDTSANWCDFYWARGGKTGADGLAFSIADQGFVSNTANSADCSADSSGIRVMNLYKIDPSKTTGLICYINKTTTAKDGTGKISQTDTLTYTHTPEAFTNVPEKSDENKKEPIGVSERDETTYSHVKEAFINYDSVRVRINNEQSSNQLYSTFRG